VKRRIVNRQKDRQCWLWLALIVLTGLRASAGSIHYERLSTPENIPHVFPWDYQGLRLLSEFPLNYELVFGGQTAFTLSSGSSFTITPALSNAVLAVRSGPNDLGGLVVPLKQGQKIGSDALGYEWLAADDSWLGPVGSTFTASRASGVIGQPFLTVGYFTGVESAYAGLQFQLAGETHYGWVRVGAPMIGFNGGWIYDFAYETRPNTPILAGAGAPLRVTLNANLRGENEVPPNRSTHSGTASFTLEGSNLWYIVRFDAGFTPRAAGIYKPAKPRLIPLRLIADLPLYLLPGNSISGQVTLNKKQIAELLAGCFCINVKTAAYPRGELRGQILPLDDNHDGVPDDVEAYIQLACPCDASWKNHGQYVDRVRRAAWPFAHSQLISLRQYFHIIQQAAHSDCGKRK